jgi:hypothetical protein
MRIAHNPKIMNRFEANHGESAAVNELSAQAVFTIVDAPSWVKQFEPRGISRVPTHAVRPVVERRAYTRAKLSLPLRVKRIAGQREHKKRTMQTTNISSSGALFLCPKRIEPGTPVEIEVLLVDHPFGRGTVRMMTEAHVVRADPSPRDGCHSLAVTFDDITFQRDEVPPSSFESA